MHDSSPNENPFSEEGNPTPRNIPDRGLKDHNLMQKLIKNEGDEKKSSLFASPCA